MASSRRICCPIPSSRPEPGRGRGASPGLEPTEPSIPSGAPMPLVSYGRALSLHAERQPDAVALVHEGKTTRYAELDRAANRLARLFARCGVGEGDFVTLALPNGREFVEALFACWKLGATPQPVSPRLPRAERDAILALVAPRLVVGV